MVSSAWGGKDLGEDEMEEEEVDLMSCLARPSPPPPPCPPSQSTPEKESCKVGNYTWLQTQLSLQLSVWPWACPIPSRYPVSPIWQWDGKSPGPSSCDTSRLSEKP